MMYFDMMNPYHFQRCLEESGNQVVLFGANATAENMLKEHGSLYSVRAVVDTDNAKWGKTIAGIPILSPSKLPGMNLPVLIMDPDYISSAELMDWLEVRPYFHWESMEIIKNNGSDNRDISQEEAVMLSEKCPNTFVYDDWFQKDYYTHAMGVVDGIKFTNSLEAFQISYAKGIRVFECDIAKDSQDVFYLCHGRNPMRNIFLCKGDTWRFLMKNEYNELDEIGFPISFAQFSREKIYGRYTPIQLETLVELMHRYPDISIIIDAKCEMERIFLKFESLDKSLFSRIMLTCTIPALEQFEKARGHENIPAILLREGDMDADLPDRRSSHNELLRVCLAHGIKAVELNENRVNLGFVRKAAEYGVRICIPITNSDSTSKIEKYKAMGVSLIEVRSN